MHVKLLNDMEITFRGNLLFYLKISSLFCKVQEGIATEEEENIARVGSPLLKSFTAKVNINNRVYLFFIIKYIYISFII